MQEKRTAIKSSKFSLQKMDTKQVENSWNILKESINRIFKMEYSTLSFEELYRNAYNLVIHKHGQYLYKGISEAIAYNLTPISESLSSASERIVLKHLKESWNKFKKYMQVIKDILMYMDRTYVPKGECLCVYDLGLQLFREGVIEVETHEEGAGAGGEGENKQLMIKLKNALLELVYKEREGELVDNSLIKEANAMFVEIGIGSRGVYERLFETVFLQATREYYRKESQLCIEQQSCSAFIEQASRRLAQEGQLAENCLDISTHRPLMDIIIEEYIKRHAALLIGMEGSGLQWLVNNHKLIEISKMFELFHKDKSTFDLLKNNLTKLIKQEGEKLIMDENAKKESIKFVLALVEMRDKYMKILEVGCRRNNFYEMAFKEAFEDFININNTMAYSLAYYTDELLRKVKSISERELEGKLDKTLALFRYIQDKDLFEGFYKNYLSKRLLNHKSASFEAEKLMISKLKIECGCQYTQKLEVMLKDINLSGDFIAELTRHRGFQMDINVRILTTGNWPIEGLVTTCNLPRELSDCQRIITTYYTNKHSGRILNWKLNMGQVDIKGYYSDEKRYEFSGTTYQGTILMLFNSYPKLSFQDLHAKTQIPPNELKRQLLSFLLFKILLSSNTKKEIKEEDVFVVNENYVSKMYRVSLPLISYKSKENGEEQIQITSKVDDDRRLLVEATIVKIMKSRKTLEHNQLVTEVIKLLSTRFMPEPAIIKKRIESLIEKEYLDRSNEDRRVYNYKA